MVLLILLTFLFTNNVYPAQSALRTPLTSSAEEGRERLLKAALKKFYGLNKIYNTKEAEKKIITYGENYIPFLTSDTYKHNHEISASREKALEYIEKGIAVLGRKFDYTRGSLVLVYVDPLTAHKTLEAKESFSIGGVTLENTITIFDKKIQFKLEEIDNLLSRVEGDSSDTETAAVMEMRKDYTPEDLIEMLKTGNDKQSLQALVAIYLRGGHFSMDGKMPPKTAARNIKSTTNINRIVGSINLKLDTILSTEDSPADNKELTLTEEEFLVLKKLIINSKLQGDSPVLANVARLIDRLETLVQESHAFFRDYDSEKDTPPIADMPWWPTNAVMAEARAIKEIIDGRTGAIEFHSEKPLQPGLKEAIDKAIIDSGNYTTFVELAAKILELPEMRKATDEPAKQLHALVVLIANRGKKIDIAKTHIAGDVAEIINLIQARPAKGAADMNTADKASEANLVETALVTLDEMVKRDTIKPNEMFKLLRIITWPINKAVEEGTLDEERIPISTLGRNLNIQEPEKTIISKGIQALARLVNIDKSKTREYIDQFLKLAEVLNSKQRFLRKETEESADTAIQLATADMGIPAIRAVAEKARLLNIPVTIIGKDEVRKDDSGIIMQNDWWLVLTHQYGSDNKIEDMKWVDIQLIGTKEQVDKFLASWKRPPLTMGGVAPYSLDELNGFPEIPKEVNIYRLACSLTTPELEDSAKKVLGKLSPDIAHKINALVAQMNQEYAERDTIASSYMTTIPEDSYIRKIISSIANDNASVHEAGKKLLDEAIAILLEEENTVNGLKKIEIALKDEEKKLNPKSDDEIASPALQSVKDALKVVREAISLPRHSVEKQEGYTLHKLAVNTPKKHVAILVSHEHGGQNISWTVDNEEMFNLRGCNLVEFKERIFEGRNPFAGYFWNRVAGDGKLGIIHWMGREIKVLVTHTWQGVTSAFHGVTWNKETTAKILHVKDRDGSLLPAIVCEFDPKDYEDTREAYGPVKLRLTYYLDRNGNLYSNFEYTNTEEPSTSEEAKTYPISTGLHPYLEGKGPWFLKSSFSKIWKTEGPEMLPTGKTAPVSGTDMDFRKGKVIDGKLNNFFSDPEWDSDGMSRTVAIDLAAGRVFTIAQSETMNHMVLYYTGEDFICAEPATGVGDAANLADRGVKNTGIVVLGPGDKFSGTTVYSEDRLKKQVASEDKVTIVLAKAINPENAYENDGFTALVCRRYLKDPEGTTLIIATSNEEYTTMQQFKNIAHIKKVENLDAEIEKNLSSAGVEGIINGSLPAGVLEGVVLNGESSLGMKLLRVNSHEL